MPKNKTAHTEYHQKSSQDGRRGTYQRRQNNSPAQPKPLARRMKPGCLTQGRQVGQGQEDLIVFSWIGNHAIQAKAGADVAATKVTNHPPPSISVPCASKTSFNNPFPELRLSDRDRDQRPRYAPMASSLQHRITQARRPSSRIRSPGSDLGTHVRGAHRGVHLLKCQLLVHDYFLQTLTCQPHMLRRDTGTT